MNAFLTGSQAYGRAHKDSDVDLVVLVDEVTKNKLIELSDTKKIPCKYGKLNIIFATSPEEYAAWLLGKINCCKETTINKDRDIEYHKQARFLFGVAYAGDSGENDTTKLNLNPEGL